MSLSLSPLIATEYSLNISKRSNICPPKGACYCYSEKEIYTLSKKIIECKKLKIENTKKTEWLDSHMGQHPAGIEWWQEPSAIIAGTVFSLSLGSIFGYYLVR